MMKPQVRRMALLGVVALGCAISALLLGHNAKAQGAEAEPASTETKTAENSEVASKEQEAPKEDQGLEHPGMKPFKANCAGCHSVGGGKLSGPDLIGLKDRIPNEAWFRDFVKNPGSMIESDSYAKEMASAYSSIMPPQGHLSDAVIADLMDFIFRGGPGLKVKKLEIDRSPENIELGRQLFTGETLFESGAPACISCHTTDDLGGLGGGTMAGFQSPEKANLTTAHTRLGGDNGTAAMLTSPQFLVMRDVYSRQPLNEKEINAMTAYFGKIARSGEAPASSGNFFLLYGLIGAALLLVLLDIAWLKRFRAVRRPMVGGRQ